LVIVLLFVAFFSVSISTLMEDPITSVDGMLKGNLYEIAVETTPPCKIYGVMGHTNKGPFKSPLWRALVHFKVTKVIGYCPRVDVGWDANVTFMADSNNAWVVLSSQSPLQGTRVRVTNSIADATSQKRKIDETELDEGPQKKMSWFHTPPGMTIVQNYNKALSKSFRSGFISSGINIASSNAAHYNCCVYNALTQGGFISRAKANEMARQIAMQDSASAPALTTRQELASLVAHNGCKGAQDSIIREALKASCNGANVDYWDFSFNTADSYREYDEKLLSFLNYVRDNLKDDYSTVVSVDYAYGGGHLILFHKSDDELHIVEYGVDDVHVTGYSGDADIWKHLGVGQANVLKEIALYIAPIGTTCKQQTGGKRSHKRNRARTKKRRKRSAKALKKSSKCGKR
jgi:hypothetical protein